VVERERETSRNETTTGTKKRKGVRRNTNPTHSFNPNRPSLKQKSPKATGKTKKKKEQMSRRPNS
jgi:hypothetical protein